MKFGVVVFPGSNCDRDCYHVVTKVLGCQAEYIWHRDRDMKGVDAVILPGGFSYGDYLRTGAIAKVSPVMEEVARLAERGHPILGICNGFQILLEAGLLEGAMLRNQSLRFICKHVYIKPTGARSAFSPRQSRPLSIPIAHAEGNYFVDDAGLSRLKDEERIVFQYCDEKGAVGSANPNGSVDSIAGICNEARNVVGMMPHPERAAESLLGSVDGRLVLEAVLG